MRGGTRAAIASALLVLAACATQQVSDPAVVAVKPVTGFRVSEESRKVISVMKFDDRTADSDRYRAWQLGIPDMIMESLGAIPYYKVISREYLVEKVLEEQQFQLAGVTDATTAVQVGRLLNAELIVVGSYVVLRDNLQISAKVLDVRSGEIVAQASSGGPVDSFYTLHNDIAIRVTQALRLELDERSSEELRGRRDTTVLAASLANYEGQDKLEQMKALERQKRAPDAAKAREEARKLFEAAVQYDSKYEKAKRNLARLSLAIPMTL